MQTYKNKFFSSKWGKILLVLFLISVCIKLYTSVMIHPSQDINDCIALFKSKDYEKAYKVCSGIANKGNPGAKILLGKMYEDGLYVQKNYDMAEKLYVESANDRSKPKVQRIGQFNLGELYKRKDFPRYNLKTSANWYKLSADLGFNEAQYKYGILLFCGYGTEKNFDVAQLYMRKASQNGLKYADKLLEVMNSPEAEEASVQLRQQLDGKTD